MTTDNTIWVAPSIEERVSIVGQLTFGKGPGHGGGGGGGMGSA